MEALLLYRVSKLMKFLIFARHTMKNILTISGREKKRAGLASHFKKRGTIGCLGVGFIKPAVVLFNLSCSPGSWNIFSRGKHLVLDNHKSMKIIPVIQIIYPYRKNIFLTASRMLDL